MVVPTNIEFIAAYSLERFGDDFEINSSKIQKLYWMRWNENSPTYWVCPTICGTSG